MRQLAQGRLKGPQRRQVQVQVLVLVLALAQVLVQGLVQGLAPQRVRVPAPAPAAARGELATLLSAAPAMESVARAEAAA